MSKSLKLCLVLLVASSLLAGCGASAAKTPKEAVKNLAKSVNNSDKDLFMATINVDDKAKEAAGAMFDMMAAMSAFSKDMEKAYGKDAAGDFKKDSIPTEEEIDKMEIKEEGDKATAKDPKGGKPMQLVKKDGAWKIDLSTDMPPESERDKMVKMSKAMVKAVNDIRPKIGKEGMTKEKINEEMGKAMMGAMVGGAA